MISYQVCKQLKQLGLTQRRHNHAKYYISENTIAYFEDIKNSFDPSKYSVMRVEEPVNWTEQFTYIPELEDLIGSVSYDRHIQDSANKYLEAHKDVQENTTKLVGETN